MHIWRTQLFLKHDFQSCTFANEREREREICIYHNHSSYGRYIYSTFNGIMFWYTLILFPKPRSHKLLPNDNRPYVHMSIRNRIAHRVSDEYPFTYTQSLQYNLYDLFGTWIQWNWPITGSIRFPCKGDRRHCWAEVASEFCARVPSTHIHTLDERALCMFVVSYAIIP